MLLLLLLPLLLFSLLPPEKTAIAIDNREGGFSEGFGLVGIPVVSEAGVDFVSNFRIISFTEETTRLDDAAIIFFLAFFLFIFGFSFLSLGLLELFVVVLLAVIFWRSCSQRNLFCGKRTVATVLNGIGREKEKIELYVN